MVQGISMFVYNALVAAVGVCFEGVSIGNASDKSTWRIDFFESATPEQRASAQAIILALDYNAYVDAEMTRKATISSNVGLVTLIDKMRNASNNQIDVWVDTRAPTLASDARDVLKAIIKVISTLV